MTIRRFVPEAPERVPLGHLELCIDDLAALLVLLRARPDIPSIVVEFGEGEFTEAADMQNLSNSDLKALRVKGGDLVVHLSAVRAEAVGKRELVDFVNNAWARTRQTRLPPPDTTWLSRNLAAVVLYVGWTGLAAFMISNIITNPQGYPGWPAVVAVPVIAALFGGMIAFFAIITRRERAYRSWTRLHALTAHELRQQQQSRTTVPLWSLIVAVVAFVASTVLGILALLINP